jgi:hypothetical protein
MRLPVRGTVPGMDQRYTLDEARQIIHREAATKICATTGHELRIQTVQMDRSGDVGHRGLAEPVALWCRYCFQEWDVVRRG